MNKKTILDFVSAINAHDVEGILAMTAKDHLCIDAHGQKWTKETVGQAWASFFQWYPDYLIEVMDLVKNREITGIFGYASGTYQGEKGAGKENHWHLPAAWRIEMEGNKVKVWQMYANTKGPLDIMQQEK